MRAHFPEHRLVIEPRGETVRKKVQKEGGMVIYDNEFETKGNKMKPRMRLLIIMNHSSI